MSPSNPVIESFERCRAQTTFMDRFYELFLASSPEIAAKFRDSDLERQKEALLESLQSMLLVREMGGLVKGHLKRVADSHSRHQRDIQGPLYDLWEDCLLQAIGEHDPQFDAELENKWRQALRPGIEFMRSRY